MIEINVHNFRVEEVTKYLKIILLVKINIVNQSD